DIHPRNKQDVGRRLARWPLHDLYGKTDTVPSGPLYRDMKIEGDSIRLSFDHLGGGLMVGKKDGLKPTSPSTDPLGEFAISDADGNWHWANATIDGDTILVSATNVKNPTNVRYAFQSNPTKANLYNKAGLPASPFRTGN
ncbi:MAG: 9-O-acetylesterase, partial [Verrucomicrobiales bacterium]|nr:9-O-acetylesterase [Verrucomicrobiales bacterium]